MQIRKYAAAALLASSFALSAGFASAATTTAVSAPMDTGSAAPAQPYRTPPTQNAWDDDCDGYNYTTVVGCPGYLPPQAPEPVTPPTQPTMPPTTLPVDTHDSGSTTPGHVEIPSVSQNNHPGA
ncbi:hypothetical protein [Nocardia pseudobrasiliensis]|uniref:hypothetical protein n=1 Tax=Nocardia pseudobrasiliensis TaxID=45979 RepID=UPI0011C0215D|nr:hypothetical protein [Nocardia pseudobrasiliensis]